MRQVEIEDVLEFMSCLAQRVLIGTRAVVLYGSCASGRATAKSDLDVLFIGTAREGSIVGLVNGLVSYSHAHEWVLDAEVPYENKLLATWDEVRSAAECSAFRKPGSPHLSPTLRNVEFLQSDTMRKRLIGNILISPTRCWTEDPHAWADLQLRARRRLVEIVSESLAADDHPVTTSSIVARLIGDGSFIGKDWLGFTPHQSTYAYLITIVNDALASTVASTLFGCSPVSAHCSLTVNQQIA